MLVDGVALLSGVPVVLLGLAALEFDWPVLLLVEGSCELLEEDWSGGLVVVADPATPPVVDGFEVELCEPDMLELELGEAMLPEAPALLFCSAAAPLTPDGSAAEPPLEHVEATSVTLVTVKLLPELADD